MNARNPTAEHHDIWELLPWLVNGRLSEGDCQRVEAHLRLCSACRDECGAQRRIYDVMSTDTAVEQMPMAGLNRLRQRIEEAERAVGLDAPPDPACPPDARRVNAAGSFRVRTAAIAASVIAISVALGMPAALRWNQTRHTSAAYYTVTTAAAQHPGEVIRAVFARTATLSELQAILDDAHLKIVSGPTEAGVYSLAMTEPQSINWSLRRLRGHDTVRFAEALVPAPVPAPPP
jgi:hypothetical protein